MFWRGVKSANVVCTWESISPGIDGRPGGVEHHLVVGIDTSAESPIQATRPASATSASPAMRRALEVAGVRVADVHDCDAHRSPSPAAASFAQPAHAVVDARAGGERNGDDDLVGARRVGDGERDRVVVRAHEQRVLVGERHVERRARSADLGGRRDPRLPAADGIPQRVAEGSGHAGHDVLLLAARPGDPALAVPLRGAAAEQSQPAAGKLGSEPGAGLDERTQVLLVAARKGVVDDGGRDRLYKRRFGGGAALVLDLLHKAEPLPDA